VFFGPPTHTARSSRRASKTRELIFVPVGGMDHGNTCFVKYRSRSEPLTNRLYYLNLSAKIVQLVSGLLLYLTWCWEGYPEACGGTAHHRALRASVTVTVHCALCAGCRLLGLGVTTRPRVVKVKRPLSRRCNGDGYAESKTCKTEARARQGLYSYQLGLKQAQRP